MSDINQHGTYDKTHPSWQAQEAGEQFMEAITASSKFGQESPETIKNGAIYQIIASPVTSENENKCKHF